MPPGVLRQLDHHADARPDAPAVVCVGGCEPDLTWSQLRQQVYAATAWTRTHTSADDVVALVSTNRPAMAAAFLGVLRAGRTLFPMDAALTAAEVEALTTRTRVARVLADAPAAERLAGDIHALSDVLQADPAGAGSDDSHRATLLLQSSGTTGGPKIVRRLGPSLDAVARNVAQATRLTARDRVIAAVPLSHSYGLENALLAPVWAGASMLHHVAAPNAPGPQRFAPDTVLSAGATVLPGVPSMFEMILAGPDGCGALRLAYSAGAPLPAALADALHARDGLALGTLYGATEIGSVTFAPTRTGEGTVGQPMHDVDVRVVDPHRPEHDLAPGATGHLAVRAPSMFDRYLDDEAPLLSTGHFLTGDLGRVDAASGEVVVTGRLKLLIDIGGRKVNPVEVEAAIADHPDIAECVVLPDPVSPTISRVKAVVTAAPGRAAPDARALRAFLKPRIAAHKLPRSVEVRESMPKSPTGKILRQRLITGNTDCQKDVACP